MQKPTREQLTQAEDRLRSLREEKAPSQSRQRRQGCRREDQRRRHLGRGKARTWHRGSYLRPAIRHRCGGSMRP